MADHLKRLARSQGVQHPLLPSSTDLGNRLVSHDLVNPYWLFPVSLLPFIWLEIAFRSICSINLPGTEVCPVCSFPDLPSFSSSRWVWCLSFSSHQDPLDWLDLLKVITASQLHQPAILAPLEVSLLVLTYCVCADGLSALTVGNTVFLQTFLVGSWSWEAWRQILLVKSKAKVISLPFPCTLLLGFLPPLSNSLTIYLVVLSLLMCPFLLPLHIPY